MPSDRLMSRDAFEKRLSASLKAANLQIKAPAKKAIMSALSERDEGAEVCRDKDGKPEADSDLRDHEIVPLLDYWKDYMAREVTPFVDDAWVDESYCDETDKQAGKIGYEINFNRYFYRYEPPRPLDEIDAELKTLEAEIAGLLKEMV